MWFERSTRETFPTERPCLQNVLDFDTVSSLCRRGLEVICEKESGAQRRHTRGSCTSSSFLGPFLPSACYAGYTVWTFIKCTKVNQKWRKHVKNMEINSDSMITTGVAKIWAFWFISFSLEYLIQTLFLHPVSVSSSNKKFWLFAILMTDRSCTTLRVLVWRILVIVILFMFISSSISWWRIISRTYLWQTKSEFTFTQTINN